MDGFSFKRLLRRPWLGILSFIISGALCLLLCLLANYRSEQLADLERVRSDFDVKCVVTDLRGTKSDRLGLSRRYTDYLKDEENGLGGFVKELLLTKEFKGGGVLGEVTVLGVSSERCDEALDPALGGGYHTDAEDFFSSEEALCLVPFENYPELAGQEISLSLKDRYGENMGLGEGSAVLKVVGWYKGSGKVFIPYPFAYGTGARLSESPSTDSAAFLLKDNDSADALREAALPTFKQVDPSSLDTGFAITVRDEQYRATLAAVQQDIKRTELLLPLISLLGLGAGFLIGFLATRGETKNYALMRTLGITPLKLALTVLFEQQILPLIACVIVGLVTKQPVPALLIFACGLVGCFAAVLRQVLVPPARLLKNNE